MLNSLIGLSDVCVSRFIFCRSALTFFCPLEDREQYLPTCLPSLPDSVCPDSEVVQAVIMQLANHFSVIDYFHFGDPWLLIGTENTEDMIRYQVKKGPAIDVMIIIAFKNLLVGGLKNIIRVGVPWADIVEYLSMVGYASFYCLRVTSLYIFQCTRMLYYWWFVVL